MNRTVPGLLKVLLCGLLLALSRPPAQAITRPENRVGGSPVFSSDFASQETAKQIVASGENPGCGYDFASGVHKYLYAGDNPINMVDPSGRDFTIASVTATATDIGYLAANLVLRAAPAIARATVVVFEATTGQSVIISGGAVVAGGTAALAKVEGGLGTWTMAAQNLQGVLFGPYGYLKAVLEGSGGQANHLNQTGAYTQIAKEAGACVDLAGNALVQGTEHNQFHFVMEQFWNQYRTGPKQGETVSNEGYLQALGNVLTVAKNATTGAATFTQSQVQALVTLARAEQKGYGYFDGPGGLAPKVPDSMNLK